MYLLRVWTTCPTLPNDFCHVSLWRGFSHSASSGPLRSYKQCAQRVNRFYHTYLSPVGKDLLYGCTERFGQNSLGSADSLDLLYSSKALCLPDLTDSSELSDLLDSLDSPDSQTCHIHNLSVFVRSVHFVSSVRSAKTPNLPDPSGALTLLHRLDPTDLQTQDSSDTPVLADLLVSLVLLKVYDSPHTLGFLGQ